MKIRTLHPWDVTFQEAVKIQESLQSQIVIRKLKKKIKLVAGVDVSTSRRSHAVWAGAVVMAFPGLMMVEERWIRGSSDFPYVPGLLSFREIPHILNVLGQLKNEPDLFLCDGQGIAHPRGLGLASHLGLITQKPSIGCAKTRLVGEYAQVEYDRGSRSDLLYRGRKVGMVLRTKKGVKPIFISPGYGVTAGQAVEIVLKCTGKYRLPEPIRKAHLLVNRARREEEG